MVRARAKVSTISIVVAFAASAFAAVEAATVELLALLASIVTVFCVSPTWTSELD